jgi:hypothetical protein
MSYRNLVSSLMQNCLYCGLPGHSVRSCKNANLRCFETDVLCLKAELEQLAMCLDETVETDEFETWIRMKPDILVRSYAIRRCGAFIRDDFDTCIEKIMANVWGSNIEYIPLEKNVFISDTKPDQETEECSICYEQTNWTNMVVLNCNHRFCSNCVQTSLKRMPHMTCAMCRSEIETYTVTNRVIHEDITKLLSRRVTM